MPQPRRRINGKSKSRMRLPQLEHEGQFVVPDSQTDPVAFVKRAMELRKRYPHMKDAEIAAVMQRKRAEQLIERSTFKKGPKWDAMPPEERIQTNEHLLRILEDADPKATRRQLRMRLARLLKKMHS